MELNNTISIISKHISPPKSKVVVGDLRVICYAERKVVQLQHLNALKPPANHHTAMTDLTTKYVPMKTLDSKQQQCFNTIIRKYLKRSTTNLISQQCGSFPAFSSIQVVRQIRASGVQYQPDTTRQKQSNSRNHGRKRYGRS